MTLVIDTVSNSKKAQSDLKRLKGSVDGIKTSMDASTRSVRNFTVGLIGAVSAGAGFAAFTKYSDTLTSVDNKLRVATSSQMAFNRAQRDAFGIAVRSRSNLEATATLYQKVAISGRRFAADQRTISKFTEAAVKTLAVAGAVQSEVFSFSLQLGQGLASGKLHGDELRTVLESNVAFADALATGLKKDVGQLRALGAAGYLTFDRITKAILEQSDAINKSFDKTNVTYGQAFEVLRTGFLSLFKEVREEANKGGIGSLAEKIHGLGLALFEFSSDFDFWVLGIKSDIYGIIIDIEILFATIAAKGASLPPIKLFNEIDIGKFFPRLEAAARTVGVITQKISDHFRQLYMDVVGGSYVPDLVTESESWFVRLGGSLDTASNVVDRLGISFKFVTVKAGILWAAFAAYGFKSLGGIFKAVTLVSGALFSLNKITGTIGFEEIFRGLERGLGFLAGPLATALNNIKDFTTKAFNYFQELYLNLFERSPMPNMEKGVEDTMKSFLGKPLDYVRDFTNLVYDNFAVMVAGVGALYGASVLFKLPKIVKTIAAVAGAAVVGTGLAAGIASGFASNKPASTKVGAKETAGTQSPESSWLEKLYKGSLGFWIRFKDYYDSFALSLRKKFEKGALAFGATPAGEIVDRLRFSTESIRDGSSGLSRPRTRQVAGNYGRRIGEQDSQGYRRDTGSFTQRVFAEFDNSTRQGLITGITAALGVALVLVFKGAGARLAIANLLTTGWLVSMAKLSDTRNIRPFVVGVVSGIIDGLKSGLDFLFSGNIILDPIGFLSLLGKTLLLFKFGRDALFGAAKTFLSAPTSFLKHALDSAELGSRKSNLEKFDSRQNRVLEGATDAQNRAQRASSRLNSVLVASLIKNEGLSPRDAKLRADRLRPGDGIGKEAGRDSRRAAIDSIRASRHLQATSENLKNVTKGTAEIDKERNSLQKLVATSQEKVGTARQAVAGQLTGFGIGLGGVIGAVSGFQIGSDIADSLNAHDPGKRMGIQLAASFIGQTAGAAAVVLASSILTAIGGATLLIGSGLIAAGFTVYALLAGLPDAWVDKFAPAAKGLRQLVEANEKIQARAIETHQRAEDASIAGDDSLVLSLNQELAGLLKEWDAHTVELKFQYNSQASLIDRALTNNLLTKNSASQIGHLGPVRDIEQTELFQERKAVADRSRDVTVLDQGAIERKLAKDIQTRSAALRGVPGSELSDVQLTNIDESIKTGNILLKRIADEDLETGLADAIVRGMLVNDERIGRISSAFSGENLEGASPGGGIGNLRALGNLIGDIFAAGTVGLYEEYRASGNSIIEGKLAAERLLISAEEMRKSSEALNAATTAILGSSNPFTGEATAPGAGVLLRSDGGDVFGAGTATSDSIPALLSNGEYVIKAKETKKYRGLLKLINNGGLAKKIAEYGNQGLSDFKNISGGMQATIRTDASGISDSAVGVEINRAVDTIANYIRMPDVNANSNLVGHTMYAATLAHEMAHLHANGSVWKEALEGTPGSRVSDSGYSSEITPAALGVSTGELLQGQSRSGTAARLKQETDANSIALAAKSVFTGIDSSIYDIFTVWSQSSYEAGDLTREAEYIASLASSFNTANVLERMGITDNLATDMYGAGLFGQSMKLKFAEDGISDHYNVAVGLISDLSDVIPSITDPAVIGEMLKSLKGNDTLADMKLYQEGYGARQKLTDAVPSERMPELVAMIQHLGTAIRLGENSAFDIHTNAKSLLSGATGYADGGSISGAGTGTSDSIFARLSNGEYVINAAAAGRNKDLLDAINTNKPIIGYINEELAKGRNVYYENTGETLRIGRMAEDAAFDGFYASAHHLLGLPSQIGLDSSGAGASVAAGLIDHELGHAVLYAMRSQNPIMRLIARMDGRYGKHIGEIQANKFASQRLEAAPDAVDKTSMGRAIALSMSSYMLSKANSENIGDRSGFLRDNTGLQSIGDFARVLFKGHDKEALDLSDDGRLNGSNFLSSGSLLYEAVQDMWAIFKDHRKQFLEFDPVAEKIRLSPYFDEKYLGKSSGHLQPEVVLDRFSNELDSAVYGNWNKNLKALNKLIEGAGAAPQSFASGGSVFGEGTATSDSIPAMLSDGEYVVNAKSANKWRSTLDMINSGSMPHFSGSNGPTNVKGSGEGIKDAVNSVGDTLVAALRSFGGVVKDLLSKLLGSTEKKASEDAAHNLTIAQSNDLLIKRKGKEGGFDTTDLNAYLQSQNLKYFDASSLNELGPEDLADVVKAIERQQEDTAKLAAIDAVQTGDKISTGEALLISTMKERNKAIALAVQRGIAKSRNNGETPEETKAIFEGIKKVLPGLNLTLAEFAALTPAAFKDVVDTARPLIDAQGGIETGSTRDNADVGPEGEEAEAKLAQEQILAVKLATLRLNSVIAAEKPLLERIKLLADKVGITISEGVLNSIGTPARKKIEGDLGTISVTQDSISSGDLSDSQRIAAQENNEAALEKMTKDVEKLEPGYKTLGEKAAASFAAQFNASVNSNLVKYLKGDQGFSDTLESLLDTFTSGVLEAFVNGLTEPLTREKGLFDKLFKSITEKIFAQAQSLGGGEEGEGGGLLGKLFSGIGGFFGGGEDSEESPDFGFLSGAGDLFSGDKEKDTDFGFGDALGGLGSTGDGTELSGTIQSGNFDIVTAIGNLDGTMDGGFAGMAQGLSALLGGAFGGDTSWTSVLVKTVVAGVSAYAGGAGSGGTVDPIQTGFGMSAAGGRITGPGNGTSDSIPTMLSNGEFIINARETSDNLALLHAINEGQLRGFVDGGLVSSSPVSKAAMGNGNSSSNTVINLSITGDISRQTRKEVLSMMPDLASGVNKFNNERGY